MTNREFYTAIAAANISDEITNKANELIATLDRRNAAKATKVTDKDILHENIKQKIVAYLNDNPNTIGTELAAAIGEKKEVVIGLCSIMVKENLLSKSTVSVPKVGKRVAYSVVA